MAYSSSMKRSRLSSDETEQLKKNIYIFFFAASAYSDRPHALWKHCQKEQFQAEGFFRLIKDINLWITAYKKLSPDPGSKNNSYRETICGTLIKAPKTL